VKKIILGFLTQTLPRPCLFDRGDILRFRNGASPRTGRARPTPRTPSVKEFFSDSAFNLMSELYALNWRRVKSFFGCVPPRHPAVGSDATTRGGAAQPRLPEGTFFSRSPPKWGSFLGGSLNFDPVFRTLPGPAPRPKLAGGCPLMWRTTYLCFPQIVMGDTAGGGEIIFFGPPFLSSDSRNCPNNFF
jgi:hypothetical protein